MKQIQFVFLFTLLIIFPGVLKAQSDNSFSHDQAKFSDEISKLLIDGDRKEGKRIAEEVWQPMWSNPASFTDQQREDLYTIADGMKDKRMRAFPDYNNFINCLVGFSSSRQKNPESFDAWLKTMKSLAKGHKKSSFEDFLVVSANLVKDNTFYSSSTTQWQSSNGNFSFSLEGDEPVIVFPQLDLRCFAKGDSSVIYATEGKYYPEKELFEGKGGKVTWQRAGLDVNKTFAIIKNKYEIKVRSAAFDMDSVLFYNTFFNYPLQGHLSEKLLANVTPETATFPRFDSYDKRLKIKGIDKGIDYEGGFTMEGASLLGTGTADEPAKLIFYRDKVPMLVARAQSYTIDPKQINAQDAQIAIYIQNDSITHPSLQLRFQRKERTLTLIRTEEGLSRSPFYDSYHKLDLYVEAIYWNIDDPLIEMGNLYGSSNTKAAFESSNYFKKRRYESLTGMDQINPLFAIRQYARQVNSNDFDATGLAYSMHYPLERITPLLIDLSTKGFLRYNIDKKMVHVEPKLNDYILNAAGRKDYDVILFNSDEPKGKNASLNLESNDLVVRGVRQVVVSDSQRVAIHPSDETVTIQKNRNFECGGVVNVGRFQFFGKKYDFDYNKFQINLVEVDSCMLYVADFDQPDNPRAPLRRVKNVIEGVGGVVKIDNPFNKSGIQTQFTQYPIFTCDKNSFVYYDNSRIQHGVYNRKRFYFELKPFEIDSLDNFNTNQVAFDGTLKSGGIFPDLSEKLTVQKDYSLGFTDNTPAAGLPLYRDKANYKNNIALNYNGLQGNGELDYLTSISKSDQFIFYPDSTQGETTSFENAQKTGPPEVPHAVTDKIKIKLLPVENELLATVQKSPLDMFNKQAKLDSGQVTLSPKGLIGGGFMTFAQAEMRSKLYKYKNSLSTLTQQISGCLA